MQQRQVTENAILSFRSDPWQQSILLKIIIMMMYNCSMEYIFEVK